MRQVQTWEQGQITLERAYQYCRRLATSHYENFTVGSLLVPRALLKHVYAIYAYCRWVDDLGDEPLPALSRSLAGAGWMYHNGQPAVQTLDYAGRMELLDRWQDELEACYNGTPTHPAMVALQDTISKFDIPRTPFLKLIEANRMEQRSNRYPTYQDLLLYCNHSANPVGHLFLYLFSYRDEERQRLADHTCTALQLANFWQDVARDYQIGRIYLPLEDMASFGYTEEELAQGIENQNFKRLMAYQVDRAQDLFQRGLSLLDTLTGVARLDVALFTMGGTAVLEAIRKQDHQVLSSRPFVSRSKKAYLFFSTWARMRLGRRISLR